MRCGIPRSPPEKASGRSRVGQGDAQGVGCGKMVTPDRRRGAASALRGRFGVSERRACRVVGQHRSTHRRPPRPIPAHDVKPRRRPRCVARNHPRLGWREAHVVVGREGWVVNWQKLRCLWREERLRRPPRRKNMKRRRGGLDGSLPRASHLNRLSGLDVEFDETANLRRLKVLSIVDEPTSEALPMDVDWSITGGDVVMVLGVSSPRRAHRLSSGWVADPSRSPGSCRTGAGCGDWARSTSSPAHRGRTSGSSRSSAGSETRC